MSICKSRFMFLVVALPVRLVHAVRDPGKPTVTLLEVETKGQTIISSASVEGQSGNESHRQSAEEGQSKNESNRTIYEEGQSENGSRLPAVRENADRGDVKWNTLDKAPFLDHLGHAVGAYNQSATTTRSTWAEYLVHWPNKLSGSGVAFMQVWRKTGMGPEWKRLGVISATVTVLLLSATLIVCICFHRPHHASDDDENDSDSSDDSSDASPPDTYVRRTVRTKTANTQQKLKAMIGKIRLPVPGRV